MFKKRRLKQLARRSFPSSRYSWKERRLHRTSLYHDMLSYQEKHPECTISDIRRRFCDESEWDDPARHLENMLPSARTVFVILCLFLLVCLALIALASTWDAPYYIIP